MSRRAAAIPPKKGEKKMNREMEKVRSMKPITARYAEKLLQKLGNDYGNDGRTFYATNEEEDAVWEFDSKKERDEFVNR